MPIIPRYQPRGGPRVGGLDYAGAYSPPDGSDWRTLAKAAALASDVSGAFNKGQAPAGDRAEAARAGLSEIDRVRAEIEALNWRRGQLDADGEAVDAEQAELSRQAAGEGLSSGVRAAFDALTAPRVEGYSALADSRRDDQRSRAARSISQARQALGVEEFLKLADVAPSQARAALGSAAAAAGELARASGADEAGVAEARRATLVAAQVRRIGETIGRDPARAAKILEEEGGVLPDAQRARLSREVELEQARVDANQAAAQMAGEHPDLVDDLDGFLAGMEATAGEGTHRIEAFRAAGMGAWRAARAAREAMESQAWAAVSPLLEPESGVHSWTQLPADLWRSLSERQQKAVQARLASPWVESDGPTMAAIQSLAVNDPDGFRDADLMGHAVELKPTDLNRMLTRQGLARAGGAEWWAEQEKLASETEGVAGLVRGPFHADGQPSLLHRVQLGPALRQGYDRAGDVNDAISTSKNMRDFLKTLPGDWKPDAPAARKVPNGEYVWEGRFNNKPLMSAEVWGRDRYIGQIYVTDEGYWFYPARPKRGAFEKFYTPPKPYSTMWDTKDGVIYSRGMSYIFREDKTGPAAAKLLTGLLSLGLSLLPSMAFDTGHSIFVGDEMSDDERFAQAAAFEVRHRQLDVRERRAEQERRLQRPTPKPRPAPKPGEFRF